MNKIISTLLFMLVLASLGCNKDGQTEQIYTVGLLAFEIPVGSQVIQTKGIDSEVRKLILNKKDTLTIELGNHAFDLKEDFIIVMLPKDKLELEAVAGKKIEKDNLIVSENAEEETKYGVFLKNYYMYDTLSGIVAEIVKPKKTSKGLTGVYISRLKDGSSFSMYGINLDSASEEQTISVIKSIHYLKE